MTALDAHLSEAERELPPSEVRAPRIYEGASEIQREIVARELFRPCL